MATQSIPQNSVTTFRQSWAPVNWTKQTVLNDYALRVTTTQTADTNTTGANFSSAFNQQINFGGTLNISATTGATAGTLAPHNHYLTSAGRVFSYTQKPLTYTPQNPTPFVVSFVQQTYTSGATGGFSGGAAHSHTFTTNSVPVSISMPNISIKYVDIIIATRGP